MKLLAIARYEFGHHFRRPVTWAYLALLLFGPLFNALSVDAAGNTLYNAPIFVGLSSLIIGLIGMIVTAGLFSDSAQRDQRWRMAPLFHSLPLRTWEYLGGRFTGALLVNALLLAGVPIGLALSTFMPGLPAEMLAPLRFESYAVPYLLLLLPNLLVNAAVLFGLTALTRRTLPGYLGAVALYAGYLIAIFWSTRLDASLAAGLIDPTGMTALGQIIETWTPVEQNASSLPMSGVVLLNRLLWLAIGAVAFAFTLARYEPTAAEPRRSRRRAAAQAEQDGGPAATTAPARAPRRHAGARARLSQTLGVARVAVRHGIFNRESLALAIGLCLFVVLLLMEAIGDPRFGTPLWPLTQAVVGILSSGAISSLLALIVSFYVGELVWRDREAGIHELGYTQPVPDWVPFAGNALALAVIVVLIQAVLVAAGMTFQAAQGFYAIRPEVYASTLFGLQLVDFILLAVLALLVHVVIDHKYLGHLIVVVLVVALGQASRLGIEHNLLIYGSDPGWTYTDLTGFGSSLRGFAWFKLYWAAWATLLAVLAMLFWTRGLQEGLRERLRIAYLRFRRGAALPVGIALALVLGTGGFVFYNTNVLNDYGTADDADLLRADYEKLYGRFERAEQPWLTGIRLNVELYPPDRRLELHGAYEMVNRSGSAIDQLHLTFNPDPAIVRDSLRFDRAHSTTLHDARRGFEVHTLAQPLLPGDTLRMEFTLRVEPRGFRNRVASIEHALTERNTFVHATTVLPTIGYQPGGELESPSRRRELGLPPQPRLPSTDDSVAVNSPRLGAGWLNIETVFGTARGQTAIAPGRLQRTWAEGGRSYFHYLTESPVPNHFGLISGRYETRRARAGDVEVAVLYHPRHDFAVDRVLDAARSSLNYFSESFGAYPHRQLLLIEVPDHVPFTARAYPGQIVFSEGSSMSAGRIEGDEFDAPRMITAHEIGHQWWGHQVMGASVEGALVLAETLAQYGALTVMERAQGPDAIHHLLRQLQIEYLNRRGNHVTPEAPLMRTTDHDHIHYRKGAVVMWALREAIGEQRVNAALRSMVERHGTKGPPFPTTEDLFRELEGVTPDSMRYLLEDLFATITLWDLRAHGARAEQTASGEWILLLDVEAAKLRSDSIGNHVEVPMDEWIEVGVFGAPAPGQDRGEPLRLERARVRSGRQTLTITVPQRPAHAGIDPFHTLIGRHKETMLFETTVEVEID